MGGSPLLGVRAGEIACPSLGVDVVALDAAGEPVVGQLGEMVIRQPMPSMPIGFWNDPDGARYRETYFADYPGFWRHGDWIRFHDDGSCVVTGCSDATLNRGGVRLGTSEFYAALNTIESVHDALVVHLEDPAGGLGELILFVVPTPGTSLDDQLCARLRAGLGRDLSPRHIPDSIRAVRAVPRTLTGKKLEVPVKRILSGVPVDHVASAGALIDEDALAEYEAMTNHRVARAQARIDLPNLTTVLRHIAA